MEKGNVMYQIIVSRWSLVYFNRMTDGTEPLHYDVFAIGEKLYCLWDNDPALLNREFLNGVDHEYFNFLADTHKDHAGQ